MMARFGTDKHPRFGRARVLGLGLLALGLVDVGDAWGSPAPGRPRLLGEAVAPPVARSPLGLVLEAGTQFPVSVGGRVMVRAPGRLFVGVGVGGLPGPYLDVVTSVAASVAGLDDTSSGLVAEGLDDGWTVGGFVGWQPFPDESFYVQVGYTHVAIQGALSGGEAVREGLDLEGIDLARARLDARARLHAISGELGFRWAVDDVRVRLSFGLEAIVASSADLEVEAPSAGAAALDRIETDARARLAEGVSRFGATPTVGLGLAYDWPL